MGLSTTCPHRLCSINVMLSVGCQKFPFWDSKFPFWDSKFPFWEVDQQSTREQLPIKRALIWICNQKHMVAHNKIFTRVIIRQESSSGSTAKETDTPHNTLHALHNICCLIWKDTLYGHFGKQGSGTVETHKCHQTEPLMDGGDRGQRSLGAK